MLRGLLASCKSHLSLRSCFSYVLIKFADLGSLTAVFVDLDIRFLVYLGFGNLYGLVRVSLLVFTLVCNRDNLWLSSSCFVHQDRLLWYFIIKIELKWLSTATCALTDEMLSLLGLLLAKSLASSFLDLVSVALGWRWTWIFLGCDETGLGSSDH